MWKAFRVAAQAAPAFGVFFALTAQVLIPVVGELLETIMAVPQNRKTSSKRDMRRSHDALTGATLAVESQSGEVHRRHHVSRDGFYRGRKAIETKE